MVARYSVQICFFCGASKIKWNKIFKRLFLVWADVKAAANMSCATEPREQATDKHDDQQDLTSTRRSVSIELKDVPYYFRNSDLFRALNPEEEGVIDIPSDCCQAADAASTHAEFSNLLLSMRFWGVDEYPEGVVLYCFEHDPADWLELVSEILCEDEKFSYKHLEHVFEQGKEASLLRAIALDRIDIVKVLAARMDDQRTNCGAMTAAAEQGSLQCLIILNQLQYAWDTKTCAVAAAGGHLPCLKYAFESFCSWDAEVYKCAALNGHVDCMVFAFDNGLQWHADVCASAAKNDQLECLRYARELGCPWTAETLRVAARHGSFKCLKYSLEEGCPVGKDLCAQACEGGHLSALQYLHDRNVPWGTETTAAAASANDVTCLRFARERGCQWDSSTTQGAAAHGCIITLRYAMENGCPYARDLAVLASCAEKNSLQCLQYLIEEQGLFMGSDGALFGGALMRADFDCVQYLLDVGCPFLVFSFDSATVVASDKFKRATYDCDMVKCLVYASDRGWKCDAKFAQFVSEQPTLPLSKEYLRREWGVRQ